jgi:hypothetical protein
MGGPQSWSGQSGEEKIELGNFSLPVLGSVTVTVLLSNDRIKNKISINFFLL